MSGQGQRRRTGGNCGGSAWQRLRKKNHTGTETQRKHSKENRQGWADCSSQFLCVFSLWLSASVVTSRAESDRDGDHPSAAYRLTCLLAQMWAAEGGICLTVNQGPAPRESRKQLVPGSYESAAATRTRPAAAP